MSQFIPRMLQKQLMKDATWFPIVSISGPRQSGKSTLVRHAFPEYPYVNLEDPQLRAAAIEDPVGFIRNRPTPLIIDEAQYAPDLFSMIQVTSDEKGATGQYILTGSQNFLMMHNIGQSLAGRVGILKLLPLSFKELKESDACSIDLLEFMLKGGYPRLYDSDIPPAVYYSNYMDTYIERDVTGVLNIRNHSAFRMMIELCAQNVGNLLNTTSLSRSIGASSPTIKSWLSVLESSYVTFMLKPYHANIKKRLTKTPKIFFYDTGLLCHLLHIESKNQLVNHPLFGAIFENLIVSETLKKHFNSGEDPKLYFYRDDSKREIDLLDLTRYDDAMAIEIKSSQTYHSRYAKQLNDVCDEISIPPANRYVVCRAESSYKAKDSNVVTAEDWLER